MSALVAPIAALLFSGAATAASGIIVLEVAGNWHRIAATLLGSNEKAPADMVSTGAPSLRLTAGRRPLAKDARLFPSQARREASPSTNPADRESGL